MQIVIAEDRDGSLSQRMHEAQTFERPRPAIHQVPGKPKPIARGIELQTLQEYLQLVVTTLQIAEGVGGFQCNIPGMANVNGAM